MNSRKKSISPGLLRSVLAVWIVASFSYWAGGILDLWQTTMHSDRVVQAPFHYDSDSLRIQSAALQPAAVHAGLAAGDRIAALNGAPYSGRSQWEAILAESRPGDSLDVQFTRANGSSGNAVVTLAHLPVPPHRLSPLLIFSQAFFVAGLLPFVCLLIGYWVALARPTDRNAWLLLLLLTFPSAIFIGAGLSTGFSLLFRNFWFQTIQIAAPPALLLFGIYFPERSRLEARARWIKWVLLGAFAVCLGFVYPALVVRYYFGGAGSFLSHTSNLAGNGINFLNLLFVLLYIALTVHKLLTASTADARRRLRILTAGMSVGVGSLLLIFILLPHLGVTLFQPRWFWVAYLGAVLFMVAPLTLAYVVLVHRALDLRVLLRAGTRYALARFTLWVLQTVLIVLIALRLLTPALHQHEPASADIAGAIAFVAILLVFRFGVRNRLQHWLDRRFFREAYNSELMLSELSDEVGRFTETQPLLETVAHRIADTLHVGQIAILLRRGDSFHIEHSIGIPTDISLVLPAQASSVRYLLNSSQPARLYRGDPDAWYLMAGTAERHALNLLGAELILPLPGRNRLMGLMTLGPKRSEAAWSRTDLQVLQTVARQTGLTLEISELAHSLAAEAAQRERVNREIEIAREVQERLFPQQMPDIPGASVAGHCRPALGVGGDYYDVISLEDGRIGLAVGDVSGKGISAALLMASLRASLRGIALDTPRDFAHLMHKVNVLVYEASASNRYATFFFAAYDPKTRRLDCVNAGHNPPIILRNGQVIRLEADGPVVGLLPFAPYSEQSLTLEPGDLLLLYTDGISEAMTPDDEEWGEERMIAIAHGIGHLSAPAALKAVFTAADAFTAGAPQHDDMTLLLLRLDPQPILDSATPNPDKPEAELAAS